MNSSATFEAKNIALDVLNAALQSLNLSNPGSFPKVDKHSEHRPQTRGSFPSNPRNAKRKKMYNCPQNYEKEKSLDQKLLCDCLGEEINGKNWMYMLAKKNVPSLVSSLATDAQATFWTKHREAQAHWNCSACGSYDLQLLMSGFVACYKCKNKFHKYCAKLDRADDSQMQWACNDCP